MRYKGQSAGGFWEILLPDKEQGKLFLTWLPSAFHEDMMLGTVAANCDQEAKAMKNAV